LPLRSASGAHRRGERGQASVELVALLPFIAAVLALAWQGVVAAEAVWAAHVAARAGARAAAVGADPAAAARAHLAAGLERGLRVREGEEAGTVRVTVRIPPVLAGLDLGTTTATGRFPSQAG
jgi:hypothetical protein